ncbi:MAG: DUF3786 domain-containing protein [Deltaproteobacteria bacterium]|nr:DUF3786 domain-containing protein [Candidatus Anaeroferrophillus wilburensis]MBN2888558.1 DUF3786 domain-containing protein [Deltaproteobacteria bacterium]
MKKQEGSMMADSQWPADPEDNRQYCRLDQLNSGWWQEAEMLLARGQGNFPHLTVTREGIELPWWGQPVLVVPAAKRMVPLAGQQPLTYQEGLVILGLLGYAVRHDQLPPATGLVSAEHLTGGTTFFRGPHVMASVLISRRFARDGAAFLTLGQAVGGQPAAYGEYGLAFSWYPGLTWIVALWEEDEEFAARAMYLFDRSIEQLFALDVIWALGNVVARKMAAP